MDSRQETDSTPLHHPKQAKHTPYTNYHTPENQKSPLTPPSSRAKIKSPESSSSEDSSDEEEDHFNNYRSPTDPDSNSEQEHDFQTLEKSNLTSFYSQTITTSGYGHAKQQVVRFPHLITTTLLPQKHHGQHGLVPTDPEQRPGPHHRSNGDDNTELPQQHPNLYPDIHGDRGGIRSHLLLLPQV